MAFGTGRAGARVGVCVGLAMRMRVAGLGVDHGDGGDGGPGAGGGRAHVSHKKPAAPKRPRAGTALNPTARR